MSEGSVGVPMRPKLRDPKTGRLLPRNAEINEEYGDAPYSETQPASTPIPDGFKPVRVWTGGPSSPQETIMRPGSNYGIKPSGAGYYLAETPDEVALLKKALGNRFWTDDPLGEGETIPPCSGCGWTTRSWRAMNWHQNNAHGRPQTIV